MKEEVANILLDANAVTLRPSQPFTFASGIKSPIYCDNRLLMSHPDKREIIVNAFLEKLKDKEFDILAGTATAGIPWCAWLSKELGKPMIYVRAKAKEHGKENSIEGKLNQGEKVIVIEDLISTGGSSVSAVEAVREAGGIVTDCVSIFTYEMEKAKNKFLEANCNMTSLTDITTLTNVASKSGHIKPEEKSSVLNWKESPAEWAGKQAQ